MELNASLLKLPYVDRIIGAVLCARHNDGGGEGL